MNWTGKLSVFCVTVFALALTGLLVTAQGEVLSSKVGDGDESAFYYPSFPSEGGPRIIAASLWDASQTEGAGGDVDSLIIVFNEPLFADSLELDDFVFDGFTANEFGRLDAETRKFVVLYDFTGTVDVGTDSVGIGYKMVRGEDGFDSRDIGMVVIGTGPVVVDVAFNQDYESLVVEDPYADNDPDFTVIFDHPIAAVGAVNTIFKTTPELSAAGILLTNVITDREIAVDRNATGDSLLWMHPGVAKLWLEPARVRWTVDTNGDVDNSGRQKVVVENQGPGLMAAYYNEHGTAGDQSDDEVFLVYDQPVWPDGVMLEDAESQYTIGWDVSNVFSAAAVQDRMPSGAAYANVLVIGSPLTSQGFVPFGSANEWIVETLPNEHQDYQQIDGMARRARCVTGTGIIRAAYLDRGTATPADDQLHLWFSEEINLADVTPYDFELMPYVEDWQSEIVFQAENVNSLGHVIITGWDAVTAFAGSRMPDGYFIKITDDAAFDGLQSDSGCDGASLIPIVDDSRPALIRLEEVPSLTYKRYNVDTAADTAFLAWRETSLTDDSDEFFLFFTNQDGTTLDDLFIMNYRQNAISAGNLTPVTVDGCVQRIAVDIDSTIGNLTTDGHQIHHGDQLRFMLVPATYWGVMADGDGEAVLIFEKPIIAGPVCPPVDFNDNDDDLIHIVATFDPADTTWAHYIFGDANAAPCGDNVHIFDGPDYLTDVELGSGPINSNGSFGNTWGDPNNPILLDDTVVDPDTLQWVWVFAEEDGAYSEPCSIRIDIVLPTFVEGKVLDLFNPYNIYKADDYVNIIMKADDRTGDPESPTSALSDMLEIYADFTGADDREELVTTFGTFSVNLIPMGWRVDEGDVDNYDFPDDDDVPLMMGALGGDEFDNDSDWEANNPGIDLDDDGDMDFPEPYVDEDGSGSFTPGETFYDRDGDDLCDCWAWDGDDREYDLNLDSVDPDEHGWYEVRLLAEADIEDSIHDWVKGFQVTDPVTDPTGMEDFGEILDIPVPFSIRDVYLDATTDLNEDTTPFLLEMDEVAPTVAKITEFYTAPAFDEAAGPGENVIIPTDPVYHMGRYLDFQMETPSDDDVLFSVAQIRESGTGTWAQLTLDPPGIAGDPDAPGVADFDDDRDVLSPLGYANDGIDNDEDGDVDEEGEGIDLQDPEVVDAGQDSTADADGDAPDGIWRLTDWRDNDNDAFFVFEPYWDVDSGTIYHKFVWFNVDERNDNDIDDDFDGTPDDAGEVEGYVALQDDNEDGIQDGEAVPIDADGVRVFVVSDSAYADTFFVAAPEILGEAPAGKPAAVVNDIRGLTEVRAGNYGVLDPGVPTPPAAYPWGDATVANAFDWSQFHNSENIDFWHIAQLFFGEIPDGTQEYDLRVVAHDQPGNFNEDYSVPITFTVDVEDPTVELAQCAIEDSTICEDAHLTLTTVNDADADSVFFEARFSTDEGVTWDAWGEAWAAADESAPFMAVFDSTFNISNDPADDYVLAQFRAYGKDEFGNVQDPDSTCIWEVEIRDCMAPITWFTLIHETPNPNNLNPVCDPATPGSTPNPYYYRDVIGPLQVPRGPDIDIWALFSPDGLAASCVHDVIRVVFEHSLAGTGIWTPFATVTGHVNPDGDIVDLTLPVAVTLETEALATGTYDIRVYACDIEGNNCTPDDEAPTVQYDIAKITIIEEGLRAYIQPVVVDCETQEPGSLDLYAINWIHDYFINSVLFQYSADGGTIWNDIATDDGNTAGDPRGDIVLRRSADDRYDEIAGHVPFVGSQDYAVGDTIETFIDYDHDGYSERDPIIRHEIYAAGPLLYDSTNDIVVLGDHDEIMGEGVFELSVFDTVEFHTGEEWFDAGEWILRENESQVDPDQALGSLEKWHVTWDVTGLAAGDYLVRAVATDDLYTVDEGDIPTETVSLDAEAPVAEITSVTTVTGGTVTAENDLYFDGETGWLKLCATSDADDLSEVLIQFRIPGHAVFGDWMDLDVNDDDDFYADIDGVPGFSDEDEIFLDTGTTPFYWDEGDLLLYGGANGELDTDELAAAIAPDMVPLWPNGAFYTADGDTIPEEDGAGADNDDDNDGMSNEDTFDPGDWNSPYCVYFPIPNLGLISDTNVEFRAVATDQSCNEDPDPAVVRLMIGETDTPETDVVWVKLGDGTEIDFLPTISDGDDVTQLGADDIADPLTLLATGEDETAITQVDLMYRKVGECYDLEEWQNPWLSMSADGYATIPPIEDPGPDEVYDFLFTVALDDLVAAHGYGVYEFYAEARDNEGNVSPAPVNPYRFKVMLNEANIVSDTDWVAAGDEFWFTAELDTPEETATVGFWYAERILDVEIDASRITPDPVNPLYQTLPLAVAMVAGTPDDPTGGRPILTVDGTAWTFYADAAGLLEAADAQGWTYEGGGIKFFAAPPATAAILVSYNVTGYSELWTDGFLWSMDDEVDQDGVSYRVAWDQEHGGVPAPVHDSTEAYDVIAVMFTADGTSECSLVEATISEGWLLMLEDEEAPEVDLFGRGLLNEDPLDYWPGNPSFDSWEGTDTIWGGDEGTIEWKLSGIEHQFFATASGPGDSGDPGDIAGVNLIFDGPYRDETTVPMTLIGTDADYVYMTFTLYESDFPEVRYGFENVTLMLGRGDEYPLTELPEGGIWQVSNVPVAVGAETPYSFAIDQDGNDYEEIVPDPRNWAVMLPKHAMREGIVIPGDWAYSSVNVPPTPFWFADGPDLGEETAVYKVKAIATDDATPVPNVGQTMWEHFVYDPVPPTVTEVTATHARFNSDEEVTVHATITDPLADPDFNVITVAEAYFQYSPNYTAAGRGLGDIVWINFGDLVDTLRTDGWSMTGTIPDPEFDGFDNDGDGEWDEADESTALMAWRVMAVDDGHNFSEPMVLAFTLDDTPPAAELTSPTDGTVYPYGSVITLTAEIIENEVGDTIHHVLFQYDKGDGFENVDITPEDASDADFDAVAPYEVTFDTADYLNEEDSYIRFRAVAVDHAFNEDDDPAEVLVIVNDITGPTAYTIFGMTTGADDWTTVTDDLHLALHGREAQLRGVAYDPNGWENLATVTVQYQAPGSPDWVTIAVVPSTEFLRDTTVVVTPESAWWTVTWDTHALAEGDYLVRAVAADIDGNADPEPLTVVVTIDNTPPTVIYAGEFGGNEPELWLENMGFVPWAYYSNDGVALQQSRAITPDPETGDVNFVILTPDADIAGIALEWHQDGTHDLGEWEAMPEAGFDYEPGLTFEYGGTTYYLWWLHVDNAREYAEAAGVSGVAEVRALATDYAGNANILHDAHNPWLTWTFDTDDPLAYDFMHDLTNPGEPQVAAGDPVTFSFVLADTTTDVVTARLEYRINGSADAWTVIDPDPATEGIEVIALTAENLDTPYCQWMGSATWWTPAPQVVDTQYDVRVIFYDTAHNWSEEILTITVEDKTAPEFTKIWAVPAEVLWVDDWYSGDNDMVYEGDCESERGKSSPMGDHDGLFIDLNGNGVFNSGTDVAIDYGAPAPGGYVLANGRPAATLGGIGDWTNTWPRMVDEVVLEGSLDEQVLVSHTVTLVGRTQIDDTGLERVEFYALPDGGSGDPILIGTDECVPAYNMANYFWQVIWNTLELDEYGNAIYPDGEYMLVAKAYDLEGNIEVWDLNEGEVVTVDNTEPEGTPDADPATAGVQPSITVERNGMLTLFATIDPAGLQDEIATFWFKRATDLNMDASWTRVLTAQGLDASDVNPDETRPYSFDWDLDKMDEPFPLDDPVVGVEYHMAIDASDILWNTESHTTAFEDGRYITFRVVDTQAPVATIVYATRATGVTEPIRNPHLMDVVHARDFAELTARILEGDNDVERVEFMWALPGDNQPQLIDAQVTRGSDRYTWEIHNWDLRTLAGQTLEVFAVATDDVGNTDFDPATGRPIEGPVFRVYVDFVAPVANVVTPYDNMKECRADSDFENEWYDLLFTSTDTDIDLDSIVWEFKYSVDEDVESNWRDCDSSGTVVFDASTGTFADKWYIGGQHHSGWKDVRLTFYDVAGNEYQQIVAHQMILDVEDPWGEITRVVVNGEDNFPTHDIDVTLGDVITLWATADDIEEEALGLGTGVEEIIFQARYAAQDSAGCGEWRDLGLWQPPDDTIYEQVVASIDWNTTGLDEGAYEARILIHDEECNEYESALIGLYIRDLEPPRARIAAFDPCVVPHGDEPPVYCDVYATGYSDTEIAEVQFQYSVDTGATWIPFGLSDDDPDGHEYSELCDLWSARLDLRGFEVGTQLLMRAIAKDSDENQDPNPPTVAVQVVELIDGSLDLVPTVDLGVLDEPWLTMVGGECPDEIVVTVKMDAADQRPQVVYVYPDTWGPDPIGYCSSAECVLMEAMIDNPQSDGDYWWRGVIHVPAPDNCGKLTVFANALYCPSGAPECSQVDLHSTYIWSREVTNALGTNGTHTVPGYVAVDDTPTQIDYLHASARVPSGSGVGGCLFLAPTTDAPGTNADQGRFMTMLDRTCYFVNLLGDTSEVELNAGYYMTVTIEYDEASLLAAVDGDAERAAAMESQLTVRMYNLDPGHDWDDYWDGYWEGWEITHVTVDTEANKVTFQAQALECEDSFYALFVPTWDAPVKVLSFTPTSPFPGRWNYTDRDPIIVADLNTTGIEVIDIATVEVWIDGQLVAAYIPEAHDGSDPLHWVQGDGELYVEQKNYDGTMWQLTYRHSVQQPYWLTHGQHTLKIMYKTEWGVDEWIELPDNAPGATFFVDADAPFIEFHGGFTGNPRLQNVSGYLNPAQLENMLTVYLYDDDAGVLVRPTDIECTNCEQCNCNLRGMKYDLWLVHDEDDQMEIDEIEERLLLHSGTADELTEYMMPPYTTPAEATEGFYTPEETLMVGLPIVAGGLPHDIQDGDILEVTLYSKKRIEQFGDYTEHCDAGLIIGPNADGVLDTLGTVWLDCYVDQASRMHIYEQGILDWAGNAGSEFVEQRFIVDMTPPNVVLISPAGGLTEPGKPFCFEVELDDDGAGIASATAVLKGPDGEEIELTSFEIVGNVIRGCVEDGLPMGHYSLVVTATDLTGNTGILSIPIVVESLTLALSEAYLYPNPVNPDDFEAIIHFNLSRHAEITAKVYDFAGDHVATIASHEPYGAGTHGDLRWAGQADDGTDLANGAYVIRLEAFDGSAHKSTTIKAVIWRE